MASGGDLRSGRRDSQVGATEESVGLSAGMVEKWCCYPLLDVSTRMVTRLPHPGITGSRPGWAIRSMAYPIPACPRAKPSTAADRGNRGSQ